MKLYFTLFTLIILHTVSPAQPVEISYGPGYAETVFLDLETQVSQSYSSTSWDIGFGTNAADFNIIINESTPSDGVELELFVASGKSYGDTIVATDLSERLHNHEESWSAGAFNLVADTTDPFDLGWGVYNPVSHQVEGSRVFVLLMRDSSYIKLKVDSLSGGTYHFKYAALDGSNEKLGVVSKADSGAPLAFYSLVDEITLSGIPSGWDLMFTRYTTPLDAGPDGIVQYLVTGILTAPGTEVVQADSVDLSSISYNDYSDQLGSTLDIIGYDWKSFDINTFQYSLPDDRVYFVKTVDENVFQLSFLDFEGSSTGVTVFEYSDLMVVPTFDKSAHSFHIHLYPNPSSSSRMVEINTGNNGISNLVLIDQQGKVVFEKEYPLIQGRNTFSVTTDRLPTGTYFLNVFSAEGHAVQTWIQQ